MIDMRIQDTTLTCRDCGQQFTFTANQQIAYTQKGYGTPGLCAFCRAAHQIAGGPTHRPDGGRDHREHSDRQMHPAVCTDCGKSMLVPFEPRSGRPVYCSRCFENHSRPGADRSRAAWDYRR